MLTIEAVRSSVRRGDFGAAIQADKLLLPEAVAEVAVPGGVRDAAEFVAYAQTFPSAFAKALQWEIADVQHALTLLAELLRGHVDDAVLHPPPVVKRRYGALDPRHLKRRDS
jgi:hypothetical protein